MLVIKNRWTETDLGCQSMLASSTSIPVDGSDPDPGFQGGGSRFLPVSPFPAGLIPARSAEPFRGSSRVGLVDLGRILRVGELFHFHVGYCRRSFRSFLPVRCCFAWQVLRNDPGPIRVPRPGANELRHDSGRSFLISERVAPRAQTNTPVSITPRAVLTQPDQSSADPDKRTCPYDPTSLMAYHDAVGVPGCESFRTRRDDTKIRVLWGSISHGKMLTFTGGFHSFVQVKRGASVPIRVVFRRAVR